MEDRENRGKGEKRKGGGEKRGEMKEEQRTGGDKKRGNETE